MILNALQVGEGPAVVILHGLFGSARNFGFTQRAIASRFRVISLDLRNHGDSPHATDMRYSTMARDVRDTIQTLGLERAAMIGHSMGGKTAMAFALLWPDRVERLMVVDIAPVTYRHENAAIIAAMQAIPLTLGLTRREADTALVESVPDSQLRAFLLNNIQLGERPRWRIGLHEVAAAIAELESWTGLPGRFDGPSLFVSGANSDYLTPEHRPFIRALFPTAKFVAVKRAGHWIHADNPTGFLSVVEAFLASRP